MKLVIKNDKSVATHQDHQEIENLYGVNADVLSTPNGTPVDLGMAVKWDKIFLEKIIISIRKKRDRYLMESDWTQLSDSPLTSTQKAEWDIYRQALRDLPSTVRNKKQKIVWPKKPSTGQGESK